MAMILSTFLALILVHSIVISGVHSMDLTALLDFKKSITDDPFGIMASWNNASHYCNWTGITCDHLARRVEILSLGSQQLVGSIPPSIGNLSFLTAIDLSNNSFRGQLPQQLGRLSTLKHLNLSNNMFSGSIPSNISRCTRLTLAVMENNHLSGPIPAQFSSLSNLEVFSVRSNNLTGTFPDWIGNLSSRFSRLSLALNNFHGSIPEGIGRLSGLTFFKMNSNRFSGELPSSIYNLSSMTSFTLTDNQFVGRFPSDLGLRYPNLIKFSVGMNNFTGEVPRSFGNGTDLTLLDFAVNSLTGTVPSVLGRLPLLYWINFEYNLLSGNINFLSSLANSTSLQILGLLSNQFTGELPTSIANLTSIEMLTLGDNRIHGNIPFGIGNLVSLTAFGLELNQFSGSIPDDFGKLQNLIVFQMNGNKLSGMIPASFGNFTAMIQLDLNDNMLQGNIPPQLGNCTSLLQLNLSTNNLTGAIPREVMSLSSLSLFLGLARNSLSGPLPDEVRKLTNLKDLDVSGNDLSGEIPSSLSSCVSLEILMMGGNLFSGAIPKPLEALRGAEVIDFSRNNLSAQIPEFLGKLPLLKRLDLSHNNLQGEVLNEGIFSNTSAVSVVGNEQLCGGNASLHLPECSSSPSKSSKKHKLLRWLTPVIASAAIFIVLIFSSSLWYMLRKPKVKHDNPSPPNDLLIISYRELHRATNCFSAESLIGSGSFGSVYKGVLGENGSSSSVAVKVLNLEQKGASRSFMDECAVLKTVRHRNLLKINTVCSSYDDQGQEFKCLVTEFMVNGSLDAWLHPSRDAFLTKTFNFVERLNIAIDVASALDYLHNQCHTPIIHCDLKPSNILLDQDFTAHVADFGLSKFLLEAPDMAVRDHTWSVQLKGSIGYIPPEYGTSAQISTLGDVYSYGVLVLELFTGKRPTDDMFDNGLSVHEHVAMSLPELVMDVVDPTLNLGDARRGYLGEFLVAVLSIGVSCSMPAARDRMLISNARKQLHSITDQIRRRRVTF